MLISFSIPEMLPMIEAGLREREGVNIDGLRVKRQTIRARGDRYVAMLEGGSGRNWNCTHDLHLWWKSRTQERRHLGTIGAATAKAFPIEIRNINGTTVMSGPFGWIEKPRLSVSWSPLQGGEAFKAQAMKDGFASVEDFRDYFAPNPGDVFVGVLFRW